MPLPFPTKVETVNLGGCRLRLCLAEDIDAVLSDYAGKTETEEDPGFDSAPYFAHLWPAASGLLRWMNQHSSMWRGQRVLELGCGLGAPSLLAARLGARVLATDYHPDCLPFLVENAHLNDVEIESRRFDWRTGDLEETFDMVLGSDLIYDPEMVEPLVDGIKNHLKPEGLFLLADPGRPALQQAATAFETRGFRTQIDIVEETFILQIDRPSHPVPQSKP